MREQKRIGMLTFHTVNNYGAVAQQYALQQAIRSIGHLPETINYHCRFITRPYGMQNLRAKGLRNYLLGICGALTYSLRTRQTKQFRRRIQTGERIAKDGLASLNGRYDAFLVGSDQVWNDALTGGDAAYLLDFVRDNKKKKSYAASVGVSALQKEHEAMYRAAWNQFETLCVREESAARLIEKMTGRRAAVALDPVFLLAEAQWKDVMSEPPVAGKYILVYMLSFSKKMVAFAQRLSQETGIPLVFIPFPMGKAVFAKSFLAAGPAQWLSLLFHAEYVITNSYHGVCFSLLFSKPFFVDIPADVAAVGSRVHDLLADFGLSQRLIQAETELIDLSPIDYTDAKQRLSAKRAQSMNTLKAMLRQEQSNDPVC